METSRPFPPAAEPGGAGDFYTLVSGEDVGRRGAPARAAWEIECLAASRGWPAGELLGSEASLRRLLGVSRETLREAIRIVESRGAMTMRRGRTGGLMLARPRIDRPAASLAAYLRAVRISPEEVAQSIRGLDQLLAWEISRIAGILPARRPEEGLRHWLARASGRQTYMLYAAALDGIARPTCTEQPLPLTLRTALGTRDPVQIFRALAPLPFAGPPAGEIDRERPLPARAAMIAVALAERAETGTGRDLGNEARLCDEFDTSRAVIRQALRILQDIDMVEVRLGRGGGYTLKRPTPIGVIRQLFVWLAARNCCPFALNELVWDLNAANVRLAGERLARMSAADRDIHCDAFDRIIAKLPPVERFIRLQQALAEIARCPMIDTLARCVVSYQARSYGDLPARPDPSSARSERAIVAALRIGKVDRAEQALRALQDRIHALTIESVGMVAAE